MTIVNTKGMAFFGPGSEWFWAALQFTAQLTLVALMLVVRRTTQEPRRTPDPATTMLTIDDVMPKR